MTWWVKDSWSRVDAPAMTLQHQVPVDDPAGVEDADEGVDAGAHGRAERVLDLAQYVAVLLGLLIWARLVTVRTGGRDAGSLVYGPLSLVPALLLLRPPVRQLVPMFTLVAAAFAVCLWSPYGFFSAQIVALAAYSGAAFAVMRCFANTAERRLLLATAICLISLDQFAQSFLPWWGSRDTHHLMVGTFYWHNQYAAFLLPGVLLGAALAVFAYRVYRVVGFVSAPICMAGIVYSTSRATMLLAAMGLGVVFVLSVIAADRRTRVPAALALGGLCVGTLFFFTSAIFFPHAGDPFGATVVRNGQTSVGRNTGFRLDFMRAAVGEAGDHPVTGGGFGSYAEASSPHLPVAAVRTISAHNEFLEAFAEGGLLWGLPVLVLVAAACLTAVRRGLGQVRRVSPDRAVAVGGALALLGLTLHAAVDFDWYYPSMPVMFAVVAGLIVAIPGREFPSTRTRPRLLVAPLAGCVLLAVGAQMTHAHEHTTKAVFESNTVLAAAGPRAAADSLLQSRSWFHDPRIDAAILNFGLAHGPSAPLTLPPAVLWKAVSGSAGYASVNDDVNARRAAVLLGLGRPEEALAAERRMAKARAHSRPATLQAYGLLLSLAGRTAQATDLLAGTIVLRAEEARTNELLGLQLYTVYEQLDELAPHSAALRCAGAALKNHHVIIPDGAPALAVLTVSDAPDRCLLMGKKGWP